MGKLEFDFRSRSFNLNNALLLAKASKAAYETGDTIKSRMKTIWDFQNFKYIDENDTQCFVAGNDKAIILAFRGTTSIEDWLTNVKIRKVTGPLGDIKVHSGFKNALDCVWARVESTVSEFQNEKSHSLWITGHSLGGALATLATARFLDADRVVKALYTLGQPRVGDEAFSDVFDVCFSSVYRLVNNEDIVTRVPFLGYKHVGQEIYFDNKGILQKDPSWFKKYSDHVLSVEIRSLEKFRNLRHQYPNSIADHATNGYIRNIRKNLLKQKGIQTFKDYLFEINNQ